MVDVLAVSGTRRPDRCLAAMLLGEAGHRPGSRDREVKSALGCMRDDQDHLPDHGVGSGSERAAKADDQSLLAGVDGLADRNLSARGTHDMDMGKCRDHTLVERDADFAHRAAHGGSDARNRVIEKRMAESRWGSKQDSQSHSKEKLYETLHGNLSLVACIAAGLARFKNGFADRIGEQERNPEWRSRRHVCRAQGFYINVEVNRAEAARLKKPSVFSPPRLFARLDFSNGLMKPSAGT